jgi:hypothetical protein
MKRVPFLIIDSEHFVDIVDDPDDDRPDGAGVHPVDLACGRSLIEDEHGLIRACSDTVRADQVGAGVGVTIDQTAQEQSLTVEEVVVDRRHDVPDDPPDLHDELLTV